MPYKMPKDIQKMYELFKDITDAYEFKDSRMLARRVRIAWQWINDECNYLVHSQKARENQ